jgi:hypothetical protein
MATSTHDVEFINHGSLWTAAPLTEQGRDWVETHIPDDAQYWGGSLVIESRYVTDIVQGMIADGLVVA